MQIRPLLTKRCYACHSGTKTNGGLALDTRAGWQTGGENGTAIVPGKPDESLLIEAIRYRSLQMPPPEAGGPLSDEEIAALAKWIALGAPDPRDVTAKLGGMSIEDAKTWWAFAPLSSPHIDVSPTQIDELIQATLEEKSLTSNSATDKRTLIKAQFDSAMLACDNRFQIKELCLR